MEKGDYPISMGQVIMVTTMNTLEKETSLKCFWCNQIFDNLVEHTRKAHPRLDPRSYDYVKETSLSEKIHPSISEKVEQGFLFEGDVKEAVQRLKEEFSVNMTWEHIMKLIDEIFGPKLTETEDREP